MKFKRKLIMKIFKLFTIVLFIIFSSLTSITYAESLKFDASTYEGEVKKGKAHGVGIFTFSDGSTYEGKVKSNKIHGKGKYTDAQGKVYEGKFKYGAFIIKIDKKTRDVIKLKSKKLVLKLVLKSKAQVLLQVNGLQQKKIHQVPMS